MPANPNGSIDRITLVAPADVVGGVPFRVGRLLFIPTVTTAEGELVACETSGVCAMSKAAVEMTAGDALFFDEGDEQVTNVPGNLPFFGYALEDAESGADTVRTMFTPYVDVGVREAVSGTVGDLDDLDTTDKATVVDAINEVYGIADGASDKIGGALSTLNTTDKASLIAAINELVTRVEALEP
jgi:predicted RecA/RadA family phage recombinase